MLGDLSGISKIFIICGRTDMRKSFDGLMAIIRDTYQMDPYANAVYLFCGRDSRKLKALYFDKDGFVLLQKRLACQKPCFRGISWPLKPSIAIQTLLQKDKSIFIKIQCFEFATVSATE